MGIWSTLVSALGLHKAVPVQDPRLTLSSEARRHLADLEPHTVIEVTLHAASSGYLVGVRERPTPSELPPVDGLHPMVHARPVDLERIRGLQLDHADGRWRVTTAVHLTAHETPNPNSRQYRTNHLLAPSALTYQPGDATLPLLVSRLFASGMVASVLVREATISVQRLPDADWTSLDRAVKAALQDHLLYCGGLLKRNEAPSVGLMAEIRAVLNRDVLPGLHADGGDLNVVGLEHGVLTVRMVGSCGTCPAADATLTGSVKRTLLAAFPDDIIDVVPID
ncbi:MAG: NifU family protein [Myxococcota bacterium]